MNISSQGNEIALLAAGSQASLDWFQPTWLQQQGYLVGTSSSSGRNPALFFHIDDGHYVLRHYYRGGLPGKLIKDHYLWMGLERTRAYQELQLLEQLTALKLPVSKPVAARVVRHGLSYQADLITERLQNCQDLVQLLSHQAFSAAQWQQLGALLARFHEHGVYHADLNARNILFNGHEFYLIDFDQGQLRQPESSWQQANLDRLLRSLHKEAGRVDNLNWQVSDWEQLMAGYQAAR